MLTLVFSRIVACPNQQSRLFTQLVRRFSGTTSLPSTNTSSTESPIEHSGLDDAEGFVRDAQIGDYDDVINISHDVYDGRDYLPSSYASFVRDPRMHCYVFENKGKVVGFEAACVVDSGETLVYRGARTRVELQGHGVMRHLRQYLLDQLTADHTVRYIAMTTSNTSGLATKPNVLRTNECLLTRAIHVFPYEQATLEEVPDTNDFKTEVLHVLDSGQLCDFFDNKILRPYLFPQDRIIINTVPFRLMSENRENIQLENPHVVISEKVLNSAHRGQKPKSGLASISTWFSCPVGICVDLEFYGRSSSFPELCNHVGHHLRHIRHLCSHGQLMVPHSKEVSADVLLCAMRRFGLTPMDCPFKYQYLFEQDLHHHPL